MLVFEVQGIIRVFYEKENEIIIHEWLEYNPEDQDDLIIEIMKKLYDAFLVYPVEKVMVKADQAKGAFSPMIHRYIKDVQIPRLLADTKMRYVVTIQSAEVMKKAYTALWQAQFEEGNRVVLHDVKSEAEAREWLKRIDSMLNRTS